MGWVQRRDGVGWAHTPGGYLLLLIQIWRLQCSCFSPAVPLCRTIPGFKPSIRRHPIQQRDMTLCFSQNSHQLRYTASHTCTCGYKLGMRHIWLHTVSWLRRKRCDSCCYVELHLSAAACSTAALSISMGSAYVTLR